MVELIGKNRSKKEWIKRDKKWDYDPSIDENIRVDCGTRLQGILERMKYYQNINTENQIDIEIIWQYSRE